MDKMKVFETVVKIVPEDWWGRKFDWNGLKKNWRFRRQQSQMYFKKCTYEVYKDHQSGATKRKSLNCSLLMANVLYVTGP